MQSEHESHRLFVAISIPLAVKAELQRFQSELAHSLPDDAVRWTRPEQLHLTLRFLGNVSVTRKNELVEKLSVACRAFKPLELSAERIGFFPERGFPRVLWTAVSDRTQQLQRLQSAVQTASLEFTSESAEKEFTGHITLGRSKKIGRKEAETLFNLASKMRQRLFGEWQMTNIELIRSVLLSDGPHYTVIRTFTLG